MNRRTITMNTGQVFTIAIDDPVPSAAHLWGVLHARLIDDVTGEPVNVPVRIEVQETELTPRIVQDGIVGLVGIPLNVFPDLVNQSYTLHFTVYAEGYQPFSTTGVISQTPTFPQAFTPRDLGNLRLIR
jgi:hypothetical protein